MQIWMKHHSSISMPDEDPPSGNPRFIESVIIDVFKELTKNPFSHVPKLVGEGDTIQGWLESMEVVYIGCNFHELLLGTQFFRGQIHVVFLGMVLDTLVDLVK